MHIAIVPNYHLSSESTSKAISGRPNVEGKAWRIDKKTLQMPFLVNKHDVTNCDVYEDNDPIG